MPPMVVARPQAPTWLPGPELLGHYAHRARAGVGLIIVEATAISPEGRLAPRQLRAWNDEHLPALAGIARAIKEHGAVALVQIHHAGANTKPGNIDGAVPVSPSGVPVKDKSGMPRELTSTEIEALIASFAAAAKRCVAAGFDGVELHGAHGYLLNQFLSPAFNRRRDEWGGPSVADRMALPLAVVRTVRAAIGPGKLLSYRLGAAECIPGGLTLPEGIEAARMLAGTGWLDLLHVSRGMGGECPAPPPDFGFSGLLWLGAQVKRAVRVPVIAVGGIKTGGEAQAALDRGAADLIAVGRAMLADPDWAAKALAHDDKRIIPCRSCRLCAHFVDPARCPARTEG